MWDISKALKVAEQKIQQIWQPWTINIFCDSQTNINDLQSCDSRTSQALKMQIDKKARQLVQYGHDILIRWIPGHNDIEGNKKADKTAKNAARKEKIQTAKQTSLIYIKQQIKKEKKLQINIQHK